MAELYVIIPLFSTHVPVLKEQRQYEDLFPNASLDPLPHWTSFLSRYPVA